MVSPFYNTVSSIDFAELKPLTVARAGSGARGGVSTDGGLHYNEFAGIPAALADGNIAISSKGTTLIWAGTASAPYRSVNAGQSWAPTSGTQGNGWIVSDRVNDLKFYFVSSGKLFASIDGGQSFTAGASGLTGTKLKAVPGVEGNLWLPGSNGLYRSVNGGTSFTKLTGVQSADAVGFGKAAAGQTHPAVFIAGSIGNVYGVYRSDNAGSTWERINDDKHQFGSIGTSITGDPRIFGRIYIATNGRGIVMGSISSITGFEGSSEELAIGRPEFTCFPNPFSRFFELKTNVPANYTIYDLSGNVVEHGNTGLNTTGGRGLRPGSYILKFPDYSQSVPLKIVKVD